MFCTFHRHGRITAAPEDQGDRLVFTILPTSG